MLAYLDTLIGFAVVMLGTSLLITILTQMASALFSHRGANLLWGLETMFQHVPNCPLLNEVDNARRLAKDVLTHPLISDSIFSVKPEWLADRLRLATAVSPEELATILKCLAAKAEYRTLAQEITHLLASRNPSADRQIELLTGAAPLVNAELPQVAPLVVDTVNSMRDKAGELEAWFAATMDRVSSRFTTYARVWTILFAFVFAGVTGMNTFALFGDLYSHGDFRQQMAGTGPQMIELTKKVMPEGAKTMQEAVQGAMTEVYTAAVNRAVKSAGSAAVAQAADGIKTEDDGKAWIAKNVADTKQRSGALAALGQEIAAGSKAFLEERTKDAAQVRSILTSSSFDVLDVRWKKGTPVGPEIPGVLATAALLSLGAPFWFNLLKSLTNLRPLVATKQDPDAK